MLINFKTVLRFSISSGLSVNLTFMFHWGNLNPNFQLKQNKVYMIT